MTVKREGLIAWANVLAPVIGAGVLGVAGLIIQSRIANDANSREYVQLGLTVLREVPNTDDREQAALRHWAVEVVDKYSPVKLSEGARDELLRKQLGLDPFAWDRARSGENCAETLTITGDTKEFDECMANRRAKFLEWKRANQAIEDAANRLHSDTPLPSDK